MGAIKSLHDDARAAQEASKALQGMVFRLQHGDSAEVARITR